MPRKLLVGGVQRNGTLKSISIKKVSPPTVPDLPVKFAFQKGINGVDSISDYDEKCYTIQAEESYSFHTRLHSSGRNNSSDSTHNCYVEESPMKKMAPGCKFNGQVHVAHVIVHSQPDSLPSSPSDPHSPNLSKVSYIGGTQCSLEDQGIDVSPGRHSPGGSSGGSSISRHSLSSLDSGRASSSGNDRNDPKAINRRLSVQSYESGSGSPQRRSYHSSSSSIGSGEDQPQGPNVAEMVLHGLPDVEVLSNWLSSLHFEEYIPLFLQAGYDMPTITRMTPEDLTAVGVTKPNHRRKVKAEIAKLNISDGIPEYKPNTLLEWLQLLRLEEYYGTLCEQGYDTIDKVTDLTWEDLEDIGIQKLGHQKKILLAIKRVEDINQGRRPNLFPEPPPKHSELSQNVSSMLSRPSTLGTIQPYHYPCQEIAIATHRQKNSPSTDSIPEMKTFQQSPVKEEFSFANIKQTIPISIVQQANGNINPVLSPCRGRSLESLNAEESATFSTSKQISYPLYHPVTEPQKSLTKDWHVTDLDMDLGYECEGTATLNRPKGLMKRKPLPKLTAEALMDIPDKEFKSLLNSDRTLDGWSSLDGSPRHGPATVPRASTLRRAPPPPPKRSNSAKGERVAVEVKKDDSSAIKMLVSQFGLLTNKQPVQMPKERELSPTHEEFPPPPSPLPSVTEADKPGTVAVNEKTEPLDELFNNPLFKQRRKDSAESSFSVESTNLPFANENIGTIKQKTSRTFPMLPVESLPPQKPSKIRGSAASRSRNETIRQRNTTEEHEYDSTPDAISPGDVIDDIENMLANLSDQLDAMLDDEQSHK